MEERPVTTTTWVPSTPDTFGGRIRLARIHAGLSLEQMGERIGVAPATLSTWERGVSPRKPGTGELARLFEEAIGVDRNWLLWGDELPVMHSHQAGSQLPWIPISAGHEPEFVDLAGEEERERALVPVC